MGKITPVPPSMRRAALGLLLLALALGAIPLATYLFRSIGEVRGFEKCREPGEAREVSRRILEYFSDYRQALSRGAIDLAAADPAVLEGNLRILLSILRDDGLLEAEIHRKSSGSEPSHAAFSARVWLGGEDGAGLRSRLIGLTAHPAVEIRSLAVSSLALIGWKVPEALASEPIPWYRREHVRALVELPEGGDEHPEIALTGFIREILRAPGSLKLWDRGPAPGPSLALGLALRAILSLRGEIPLDLGEGLLAVEGLQGSDQILQVQALARASHPEAWRFLAKAASESGSLQVRRESIGALKILAPIEAIPALREIAGRDPSLADLCREAAEHIGGEPMPDWTRFHPLPGRLSALRSVPKTRAEEARQVSAIDFYGRNPELAGKSDQVPRLLATLLSSPVRGVRIEAARTLGRLRFSEALGPETGGEGRAGQRNSLFDLLLDPDFRVSAAAAGALFDITAFWPGGEGVPPGDGGTLSLDLAIEDVRFRQWVLAWEAWRSRSRNASEADWYLDALEASSSRRIVCGARGLVALVRRGALEFSWYSKARDRILKAFRKAPGEGKVWILGTLSALEDPERAGDLWDLFDGTFRTDPSLAWELLESIHRIRLRKEGEKGGAQILDWMISRLAREAGAPSVLLFHHLSSRFQADLLDERVLEAIRRYSPGPTGEDPAETVRRGADRANLVRWFPQAPTRAKAQAIVEFLSDPEAKVRFWALRHLKDLGGTDFGLDPVKTPEPRWAEALGKWKEWAAEWEPGGSR